MDVSAQQNGETWINRAFCIPSVPASRREHYPFSKCASSIYRLKLTVVLLNAACALWRAEDPCHYLSLLLNCWLLFVMCEGVFRNYPWREPLTVWMWQLYWAIPYSGILLSAFIVLLILFSTYLGTRCELANPLAAASICWLCCMAVWPLVRERMRRETSDVDYDQFSSARPPSLLLPSTFGVICAALRSPSIVTLLVAHTTASVIGLCLRGLTADFWMVSAAALALGCLAALCCRRLPKDVAHRLATLKAMEDAFALRIENNLRSIKSHLGTLGHPQEGTAKFDQLAIQVPLLVQETEILRNARWFNAEELRKLANAKNVLKFREKLYSYGPYTNECCIS